MQKMTYRVLLMLLAVAALFGQEGPTPQFGDYPATVTHGSNAAPKFSTAGQRTFRTRIRDAAEQGPNFAGHYTVAEWGCGTGCVQMAVVDNQSGAVYDGPLGALPKTLVCVGDLPVEQAGYIYHDNSSLLVVGGCPNNTACGAYYYQWTANQWKLLRRVASKVTGC